MRLIGHESSFVETGAGDPKVEGSWDVCAESDEARQNETSPSDRQKGNVQESEGSKKDRQVGSLKLLT